MKNDAKKEQSRAGTYERSSDINGKPCYKKGDDAIWYYPELNEWMIGSISSLGSSRRGIKTKDKFGGLGDDRNTWEYWNGDEWKTAGPNDITAKCTSGTSTLFFGRHVLLGF